MFKLRKSSKGVTTNSCRLELQKIILEVPSSSMNLNLFTASNSCGRLFRLLFLLGLKSSLSSGWEGSNPPEPRGRPTELEPKQLSRAMGPWFSISDNVGQFEGATRSSCRRRGSIPPEPRGRPTELEPKQLSGAMGPCFSFREGDVVPHALPNKLLKFRANICCSNLHLVKKV
jgi:hypothetical protein